MARDVLFVIMSRVHILMLGDPGGKINNQPAGLSCEDGGFPENSEATQAPPMLTAPPIVSEA
jgi:hypothetical protein